MTAAAGGVFYRTTGAVPPCQAALQSGTACPDVAVYALRLAGWPYRRKTAVCARHARAYRRRPQVVQLWGVLQPPPPVLPGP